jgi:tetratricopeptide (TPR) repeat protein
VNLVEKGKRRPSPRSVRVITKRLAVPIREMLVGPPGSTRDQEAVNELEALIQGRHYEQALKQGGELLDQVQAPAARALLHRCLGHALGRLRRLTEACKQLNLTETLFVSLGNRGLVAQTMELRALALQIAEQPEALSVAEQALDRYRALRQRRPEVESRLLERLGTILAGRGDHEAARVHYEEAFERAAGVRGVDIKAGVLRQARARLQLSLAQVGGNELTREAVRLIETGQGIPRGAGTVPPGTPSRSGTHPGLAVVSSGRTRFRRRA